MKMLIHKQYIDGAVRRIHLSEPEIFVDNEKRDRSGHMGHAMAEFAPGKLIAFSANHSSKRHLGHAAFGWMEYRISEDYGKTWGELKTLDYSMKVFLDGINTVSVEKAVACDDGSIVAFCLMNVYDGGVYIGAKYDEPMYIRSEDGGETWSEAKALTGYKGRIYDAVYHEGDIYLLMFCSESFFSEKPEDLYRIFKSEDNGKTFYEYSVVGFESTEKRAYGNMVFTPDNRLIVYAYNEKDEFNMDCVVSDDMGLTWGIKCKSPIAKKIRNPQVNILDGQYILHGRAGENEAGTGAFVFYTSADGINWDEGKILVDGRPACFYSNNLVIKCPDGKERMLVQYSENYNDPEPGAWSGQVNVMHMWIESV